MLIRLSFIHERQTIFNMERANNKYAVLIRFFTFFHPCSAWPCLALLNKIGMPFSDPVQCSFAPRGREFPRGHVPRMITWQPSHCRRERRIPYPQVVIGERVRAKQIERVQVPHLLHIRSSNIVICIRMRDSLHTQLDAGYRIRYKDT